MMIRFLKTVLLFGLSAVAIMGTSLSAEGQDCLEVCRPSVAEVLDLLDRGERGLVPDYSFSSVLAWMEPILEERATSPASADSVVVGLEELVSSDNAAVRVSALMALITFGDPEILSPPLEGTLARLLRIYRATTDTGLQTTILGSILDLEETAAAFVFVKERARGSGGSDDFPGAADIAIVELSQWGAEGLAALRELYEAGQLSTQLDVATWLLIGELAREHGWQRPAAN